MLGRTAWLKGDIFCCDWVSFGACQDLQLHCWGCFIRGSFGNSDECSRYRNLQTVRTIATIHGCNRPWIHTHEIQKHPVPHVQGSWMPCFFMKPFICWAPDPNHNTYCQEVGRHPADSQDYRKCRRSCCRCFCCCKLWWELCWFLIVGMFCSRSSERSKPILCMTCERLLNRNDHGKNGRNEQEPFSIFISMYAIALWVLCLWKSKDTAKHMRTAQFSPLAPFLEVPGSACVSSRGELRGVSTMVMDRPDPFTVERWGHSPTSGSTGNVFWQIDLQHNSSIYCSQKYNTLLVISTTVGSAAIVRWHTDEKAEKSEYYWILIYRLIMMVKKTRSSKCFSLHDICEHDCSSHQALNQIQDSLSIPKRLVAEVLESWSRSHNFANAAHCRSWRWRWERYH